MTATAPGFNMENKVTRANCESISLHLTMSLDGRADEKIYPIENQFNIAVMQRNLQDTIPLHLFPL